MTIGSFGNFVQHIIEALSLVLHVIALMGTQQRL
jgi:hypothetical protein